MFSPDPAHSEIAARAGFDFVIVDTEHAALSAKNVLDHVRAGKLAGADVIARLRTGSPADIGRLLDTGVDGLVHPHAGLGHTSTIDALSAMRYPPSGGRPTCTGTRSAEYGLGDFQSLAAEADSRLVSVGLVEDVTAVERVDEIASLGFDVLIPGAADLAAAYGVPGQLTHPNVVDAIDRVHAAAARAGLHSGVYVRSGEEAQRWLDRGVSMVIASIDYRVLAQAYASLAAGFRPNVKPDSDQRRQETVA